MKPFFVVFTVLISVGLLFAHVPTSGQAAAPPKSVGPTKVMGKPLTTASGVEYWDIKLGTGAVAVAGKTITVHYTGWLTDGKKFDSSVDKDEPFEFPLGAGR